MVIFPCDITASRTRQAFSLLTIAHGSKITHINFPFDITVRREKAWDRGSVPSTCIRALCASATAAALPPVLPLQTHAYISYSANIFIALPWLSACQSQGRSLALVHNSYLSTVPNQSGQSRFLLLCPAVPPSTPFVPNLSAVAASVLLPRAAPRAHETA